MKTHNMRKIVNQKKKRILLEQANEDLRQFMVITRASEWLDSFNKIVNTKRRI